MPIRKSLWNRPSLLSGLGLAIALLIAFAPPTGADEPVQVAQAEAPPPPPPGEGVEEIIVRGAESQAAEDFSAADSVTAFSAADLVALGAANIADLATFTPNLEIVTAGATTPTFFIRGVGLNDFNANSTSAVSVYQDDVPMNAPALQLGTLFDMENVSVLRGPQGTGLARNSSAGAIKLYARKPTGQFNGFLRTQWGNFDHQQYEGAIEAPMFEDIVSSRFAFLYTNRDGTMKNRCGDMPVERTVNPSFPVKNLPPFSLCGEPVAPFNSSDIPPFLPRRVNDRNNWAARGQVLVEPTLDISLLFGAHGTRRNEFSRLGQAYGTNGFYCLEGLVEFCGGGAAGLFPRGSRITNVLGGSQGAGASSGYQAPEIRTRWTLLAPCYNFGTGFCGNGPTGPNGPNFILWDTAKRVVADEVARNLDDEPWAGDFNRVGKTVNDTYGASGRGTFMLPWDLELSTVTGYDTYRRKIDIDLDFSPETLFHIFTRDKGYQFYQDLNLAGETNVAPDSPVEWDIGGWLLKERLHIGINNDFGRISFASATGRRYTQNILSLGGYGSFSYDFWDDFTLDGGVRYNWEDKDINYILQEGLGALITPLNERDIFQAPTGTLRLTYRFREDTHAFWKYTRGWKPGHYNATGSRVTGITIARPEYIDAFETGVRGEWFNGIFGAELSLFYYNYKDYQIFTAQQFADSAPEFVVINANDAEVYGAEIDTLLRPWDGGYLNVRFGWLETQFLDFVLLQQATIGTASGNIIITRELQNSGNPLLNSPRFKVSITAEQAIPFWKYGFFVPRYDGAWSDDTFYDATKGRGQPNNQGVFFMPKYAIAQRAYWIHNAQLAYRSPDGRFELAGWIRNIENKAFKQYAFDGSTFQSTSIHFVGDPRTYGVTFTVTF